MLLQWPIVAGIGFLTLYLAVLSVLAGCAPNRPLPRARRQRRFAFVVPAHNEAGGLDPTLRNLQAVDYPDGLREVVVIADNCTDETAAIAARAGTTVLERSDENRRGKGHALRWAFDHLLARPEPPDAVIVVDADSTVSPGFLETVNTYLDLGHQVVQASDVVRPSPESWHTESTRLGFALYNHVRPLGRSVFGGTAGLRGNGMCFTAEVLRMHPWSAVSLAEDLEYGLHLLLHGIRPVFAPEAQVLALMPRDPAHARSQHARWGGGRFPLVREYTAPLLRAAIIQRSFIPLDACIDLVTPPLTTLGAILLGGVLVNAILVPTGVAGALPFLLLWLAAGGCAVVHVLGGIVTMRDPSLWKPLLRFPRFLVWKLGTTLHLVAHRRPENWIRTTREGEPPRP